MNLVELQLSHYHVYIIATLLNYFHVFKYLYYVYSVCNFIFLNKVMISTNTEFKKKEQNNLDLL